MIIMQKMMEQSHIKVFKIIAEKEYGRPDKSSAVFAGGKVYLLRSLVIVLNTPTPWPAVSVTNKLNFSLFPPETSCDGALLRTVDWRCVDNSRNLSSS